jgi:hypothetical protein
MTGTLTPAEWALLADTPLAVAAAVALAEPGGAQRETAALLDAWRNGAELFPNSVVVQHLVRDYDPAEREPTDTSGARGLPPTPRRVEAEAVELCRRTVQLLEQRVQSAELEAYQRFVLHIAARVAQADRDGGAFGVGGVAVSLDERSVLRAIRVALEYTPPGLRI